MAKATESKETRKDNAYYDELVTIKLFKDNDRYKDDVFVAVNGVGMMVPRGKEVEIPRKYAVALQNSEAQDSFAAQHCMELAKNAESPELN
ncbi:MAG: hypothetical protein IKA95_01710 [Clostridia bacterium]|nr:hypothetical protein [Clostridia bacterium]